MKLIQGDESVQSFIFRVLMINGESDFTGLINQHGKWRAYPFVKSIQSGNFKHYDKEELLDTLQRSGIAKPLAGMFSNPVSHFEIVSSVFRHGIQNYSMQTQNAFLSINFCRDCIAIDLRNLGFGYFRAAWLNEKYCLHHKKALFTLTTANLRSSVSNLKEMLRGEIVTECQQYDIDGEPDCFSRNVAEEKIKFAPCMQKPLLHWLRKSCNELDGNTPPSQHISSLLKRKTGLYEEVNDVQLSSICKMTRDNHPEKFEDFVNKISDQIYTYLKVDEHVFTSKQRVVKDRNCSTCILQSEGYQCSETKIIKLVKLRENRETFQENPCDYYLTNKRPYYIDHPVSNRKDVDDDVWAIFAKTEKD
ncbi:hypothetical protein [Paraglaciecola chathamensis]|uniref:Uncharacterized protein n=1 Tax=Paraglaciecola chathamensis S18K6 TaxID=1127672 RepID=A0AAV3UST1_9ALTE|nr:hypothetical protein [Paraglaciecola chathamensis]GAC08258.1 hypothetical protein GCHA_0293 [Paraglaciecola chathamensis S18K6]